MQPLFPGEQVSIPEDPSSQVVLGPGLRRQQNDKIIASQCGLLRSKSGPPSMYWLDTQTKRYLPVKGDKVIGIVTQKTGESYKIDLGSAESATISYLSFEGSTKKMKPNLKIGDLIYCQLLVAIKDMEPEVVCMDSEGKSRGMGLLPVGGFMFQTSLSLERKILSPSCNILQLLGKDLKFEITCGMNGRIWIKSHSLKETVIICNTIAQCEYMNNEQIGVLVTKSMSKLRGI